jgi:hypothetical protein
MTSAGVNAHHQNGIAERRIRELQELARTTLIYILNSSRHVYQTSISRRLHFMLLAEWAGELDRD